MIKKHLNNYPAIIAAWSGLLLLCSCGRDSASVRTYQQVDIAASEPGNRSMMAMPSPGGAESGPDEVQWTAPRGWSETRSQGMRRATFTMSDGRQTGTCTIVVLSGMAGGLEANVVRWLGQLGRTPPPDEDFQAFLSRQTRFDTEGGFKAVAVDLSGLNQPEDDQAPSMIGAIIPAGGSMWFIKLTGSTGLLKSEKERFLELCRSLRNPQ